MLDEALFMEARLFRMFRESRGLSAREANHVFESQGIWTFLENCYDALHLEGDEAILNDIDRKLANQGTA